jgi:hypothetical protein
VKFLIALVAIGCATQPATAPTSTGICQARAVLPVDQTAIASVATQNNTTPSDVQGQFVSACSAQVDNDIGIIEHDLLGIAAGDAGVQEKKK